jgi:hypothetical protein
MWYASLTEVVFIPNMSMINASNCEIGKVIAFGKVVNSPLSFYFEK